MMQRWPDTDVYERSKQRWLAKNGELASNALIFFAQRCLGMSRAVRPSVSKAKATTGMYNGPLNVQPESELSNKLNNKLRRISGQEGPMENG